MGSLAQEPWNKASVASVLPPSYDDYTTANPHNLLCTAQVGLKRLSCTPGRYSVYDVKTPLGLDQKIFFIRRKSILSVFLSLNT